MRIAQINFNRVNNALGGVEKVFISMGHELASRGHDVACFYSDKQPGKPLFPIHKNQHVENCYGGLSKLKRLLIRIRACLSFDKNKRRKIRHALQLNTYIVKKILDFNPDVIILYQPCHFIEELNKLNIPVVQMFHGVPSFYLENNALTHIKDELEKCDCIQVLLPNYIPMLYSFIKNDNMVCIPNIVPQYDVQSDVRSKTIIYVGRISEEKRPELIPLAFALLKEKYPDWKVELWGEEHTDTKTTARVRQIVKKHGLEDHVLFCGTTMDIKSKLQNASIIIMPSIHEGFCLALTEGMSMGLPAVVCNDCDTLKMHVQHNKNGMVCEPTPEDIALNLSKLMDSYELRKTLGQQAREDMRQYRPEAVYDKWERLLEEVIEKKKITQKNA